MLDIKGTRYAFCTATSSRVLATKEFPYRGPEYYQSGEYLYKTKVIGDISWFQGYEEIFFHNRKVYECYYHGGTLL